jgi:1,4-alpha-glucan branching enzyme
MTDAALDQAVVSLEHGTNSDPFAVLGPHRAEVNGRPGLVVRVFLPEAQSIELHAAFLAQPLPMRRGHGAGFFEAFVPGWTDVPLAFDYRLRVTWRDGRTTEVVDPYRFGRILSDYDLYLFAEGTQLRGQEKLGAHPLQLGPIAGVHFAVWAPNADRVSVVGDFNMWDGRVNPMRLLMPHGVWELFVPGISNGEKYKFEIRARTGEVFQKTDPYALRLETPPRSASIVWDVPPFNWTDEAWMESRPDHNSWLDRPMSIY